jgi:hypothetical protein
MSNDQPVSVLVKEGFGRRAVLQALMAGAGASVATPALAMGHEHPMHEALQSPARVGTADRKASAPGYKPQLLDKHVFDTLVVLSEAIVPGSTKARVAEFIDALLAVETPATQRRFFTAVGAMEGLAIAEHRKAWKSLTAAEQTALLTKASTATATPRGPGGPARARHGGRHPRAVRTPEGLDLRRLLLHRDRDARARLERRGLLRPASGMWPR